MKGPKILLEKENNWDTKMGLSFPGERVVYRGKDLLCGLRDLNWMGLLLYGITGRLFNDKQIRLFEGLWVLSTSYPDPRLWNNRVASLAGTARSTQTLGISAAIAVSEATIYGHRANVGAIDFFIRTKKAMDSGVELSKVIKNELKENRVIYGFGRPVVRNDERITPVIQFAKELGFGNGPYVKLAFEIEEFLLSGRWRMQMNITGLAAALSADQGLSQTEYHSLASPCFLAGIIPCLIDSMSQPEGSFLPIRCARIKYGGKSPRQWKYKNNQ
jgi:citrate synthase